MGVGVSRGGRVVVAPTLDVPQAVTHWQSLKGFHLPSNVKVRERISKYF